MRSSRTPVVKHRRPSADETRVSNPTEVLPEVLSQEQIDQLLAIQDFIRQEEGERKSLIDEIKDAILDSGKLSLGDWVMLRERLTEIERLIPHIDLVIRLKQDRK